MANGIIKDFSGWNLLTEDNDMVKPIPQNSPLNSPTLNLNFSNPIPGVTPPDTTLTTTLAPNVPKTPAELDALVKEIANMIVALFDDNPIWTTNDLKLNAKRLGFNDNEADGVKIFVDYWTKKIVPKIYMLPVENKNKASLTDLKTQISNAIMAKTTDFSFKITVSTSSQPISYTINADF